MDERVRILFVDDEKNVLRALERLFLDDDYEIVTALSGEEGLNLLQCEESAQIVISDYRMPGMNGVEFLREVCRSWPDTVRIVLSGYADTAAIVNAINEGEIYRFIPKPWNDDELKVTIVNALERYCLQQYNRELMERLAESNSELQTMNENLETLLAEGTSELEHQNKLLSHSHYLLNSLPIALLEVNLDGCIINCNRTGADLLGLNIEEVMGSKRQELFSPELNEFIEKIRIQEIVAGHFPINGRRMRVKGISMKDFDQEAKILLLDSEA